MPLVLPVAVVSRDPRLREPGHRPIASVATWFAMVAFSLVSFDASGCVVAESVPWLLRSLAHGDGAHLYGNAVLLALFAPGLERQIGWRRFLVLLAAVELLGRLHRGDDWGYGASHWCMAAVAARTVLEPRARVRCLWWLFWWGAFELPVMLLLVMAVWCDVFALMADRPYGDHAAHLFGACLGGVSAWGWRRRG